MTDRDGTIPASWMTIYNIINNNFLHCAVRNTYKRFCKQNC